MGDITSGNTVGTLSSPSIRILSLDGGGTRGLSSLIVLRDLMEKVAIKKGITQYDLIRPSECFDLIVGTGTGGLSALLLGRLRMTVNEAIVAYQLVAKAAFQPQTIVSWALRRSRSSLEQCLGDIIERYLNDRNAPLFDPAGDNMCRTAVLVGISANVGAPPHIFRSYASSFPTSQFTVREVVRAVIAPAGQSSPVLLGTPPVEFISAGLVGHNNPAYVACLEAGKIWPRSEIVCLVSLGTGLQRIVQMGGTWRKQIEACAQIMQDCENVHRTMYQRQMTSDSTSLVAFTTLILGSGHNQGLTGALLGLLLAICRSQRSLILWILVQRY